MSNISETAPASERQNPTEKARAELRELERENDLKVESERDEHWKYIDLGKLSAEEAGLWNSFAAARTSQELEEATADSGRIGTFSTPDSTRSNRPGRISTGIRRTGRRSWNGLPTA